MPLHNSLGFSNRILEGTLMIPSLVGRLPGVAGHDTVNHSIQFVNPVSGLTQTQLKPTGTIETADNLHNM